MVENRGKFFLNKFTVFIVIVLVFGSLFQIRNVQALNKANNPFFASNASGWTVTNGSGTNVCGNTGSTTGTSFESFAFDGTTGNPSGSFKAELNTSSNNESRYGKITQTAAAPGSGTVKVKGRFDFSANAADTQWSGTANTSWIRLDLYDSADSAFVANLACTSFNSNQAWTTVAFGSDISLTGGTTYTIRLTFKAQNSSTNGAIGLWADNVIVDFAPTGLSASLPGGTSTNTSLSWTASTAGTGAAGLHGSTPYKIYRSTSSPVTISNFLSNATTNSYTDTSSVGNTVYYYAISDVDTNNIESPLSAEASILTRPGVPGTPTFSNIGETSLRVNWTAPTGGAISYKVERCQSSGCTDFLQIASAVTNIYYDDSGLSVNTTYRYQIRATNSSGDGAYSGIGTTITLPATPGTPTFSNIGETSLRVNWTAPTGGATSYKIERCAGVGCSSFGEIATGVSTLYYDDSSLSTNTTYRYQIRATNASGDGAYSGIGTTITRPGAPSTPTFTNVNEITLTVNWTAPAGGADNYKVERCQGSGCTDFLQIASAVTNIYYDDSGLSVNTTYRYQIRATNSSGDGAYSGIGSVTTSATPIITVSSTGNQTSSMIIPSTNNYLGGAFTFSRSSGSTDITQIILTETGSVNANLNLSNAKIYYETAGSCSYDTGETLFGTATSFDTSAKATITGTISVGTSQVCAYVILDVGSGASNNETLDIQISNPSTDVTASVGTVAPATAVAISGTTNLLVKPNVSSVSPNNGKLAGGTNVTITGTGFLSGATVTFGGSSATNVVVVSGTSITATTPAHSAGAVDVVVTNTNGQSGTLTGGYTYNPSPTVSSINPTEGPIGGNTNVTITGTGFLSGATVTFGGSAVTNVVVVSGTSITATTPAHSAGAVDVVVTNIDTQSGTLAGGFTYISGPVITSVSPNNGKLAGGTNVTITGTGFLSGATVTFGGSSATNVVVVSGTSITATTPAHSAGAVDVVVTNTDTQSGTLLNGFEYVGPPVINITANPATIVSGELSVLNWTSTDANTCTASGAWSGAKAMTGNEIVSPTSTSTYTLTCDGPGGSSQSSVIVTVSAQAPSAVGGWGGLQFRFDGFAYAGGTVTFYDRGAPVARLTAGDNGSFSMIFRVYDFAKHVYSIIAYDRDKQSSPQKTFPSDVYSAGRASDILMAPTINLSKRTISKTGEINTYGYATPKRKVKIDIDGKIEKEIISSETGYYSALISAGKFADGSHKIRARQIDDTGKESDYSILKLFNISEPFVANTDLNNDNVLTISDWSIFLSSWASKEEKIRLKIDLNGDGKINVSDLSIFLRAFSKKK